MTVAGRIKARREELNITQEELAFKLGLKGKSSVCKIESSGDNISTKSIRRYAEALDTTIAYLMGWDDTPMNPASRAVEQIITTNEDLGGSSKAAEFFHRTAKSVDAPAAPSTNSDMVKLFPEEKDLINKWRMVDDEVKDMIVRLLAFAVEQENKKG